MNSRAIRNERRVDPATAFVAGRVRELRASAGLTGEQVAGAVGWHRSTLVKLETGKRETITVQELLGLAGVLRVPVTALLPDQGCSTCYENPPPGFTCNACGKLAAAGRGTQVPQE